MRALFWLLALLCCASAALAQPAITGYGPGSLPGWVGPFAWTPTFNFGGAHVGMTFSTQTGQYYTSGPLVHACADLTLSAKGSSTGAATIDTLPIAMAATPSKVATLNIPYTGMGFGSGGMAAVFAGGTSISLYSANNGAGAISDTSFGATTAITFCIDYPRT